jgi:hypothetical protein
MASPQLQPTFCPNKCELHTLTASQLGSLIALFLGLLFLVFNYLRNGETFEQQYVVIFLATAMYYFMEAWILEEDHVQALRSLPGNLATVEFWLRVSAVVLLGFIAVIPQSLSHFTHFDTTDARLYLMACLYNLFLAWDYVLYKGKVNDPKLVPFWGDFLGFLITVACLFNRRWLHHNNSLLALGLVLVVAFQAYRSGLGGMLKRIPKRAELR